MSNSAVYFVKFGLISVEKNIDAERPHRTGNYVPMVWLRREKIVTEREVRDEAIRNERRKD